MPRLGKKVRGSYSYYDLLLSTAFDGPTIGSGFCSTRTLSEAAALLQRCVDESTAVSGVQGSEILGTSSA